MPSVPRDRRRSLSRHGLEPRNYDAAVLENQNRDLKRVSDFDPRNRDDGYLGFPLPDPNRKAPWGI